MSADSVHSFVPTSPQFTLMKICCNFLPKRCVIVLIASIANAIEYTLRANLSITIVAMVKATGTGNSTANSVSTGLPGGEFEWSPTTQGIILGSFYYGYVITHLVGGQLAQYFGAKYLIGFSLFISSLLTLLTPWAAYSNVWLLITLRIVTGIAQGVMTPAVYTMFAHWIPSHERSTALAIIVVGGNIGALVTMTLSAYLCNHGGWPLVFYVFGTLGTLCFASWLYLVYDRPALHPRITDQELQYIQENIESEKTDENSGKNVPWTHILLSTSVWATAMAKFAGSWGYYMLLTKLPAYFESVLKFSIDENGNVNALVYVAMSLALAAAGYLSDTIERRKLLSKCLSRKLFECVALIGPAIAMIFIPSFGENHNLIIGLLVLSMTLYGFYSGGDNPIVVDMAPDYSGSVYGLTCAISSIPGFVAPVFVGFVLDLEPGNARMWDYVFYVSALIYVLGAVVFVLFASAKPTTWGRLARPDEEENCA